MRGRIKAPYSYYGGKSRIIGRYPKPKHDLIIEPFCGAAAYAFAYADHQIWINDLDPITYGIWKFLTDPEASTWMSYVPHQVVAGEKVSELIPEAPTGLINLCQAEANQGTQGAKGIHDQITAVGAKCWNARFWDKTIEVIARVKGWKVTNLDYHDIPNQEATWFVDPPYMNAAGGRYRQGPSGIDYAELANWCRERSGQVIVCENEGATWLPFEPLVERQGMRGRYQKSKAMEVVWANEV